MILKSLIDMCYAGCDTDITKLKMASREYHDSIWHDVLPNCKIITGSK
jgi:hypothetical protein